MSIDEYPDTVKADILNAVKVLKDLGARDVYLFGSVLTSPDLSTIGDIDFAVAGLAPEKFFKAYASLTMKLEHAFDLVDLENEAAFVRSLRERGNLERVA
jgi:predicted nucleotidyltransferase